MSSVDVEKLNELMLKLLGCKTLEETYKVTVDIAVGIFNTPYGSIHIKSGKHFEPVFSTLPPRYHFRPRRKGFLYEAYKNEDVIMLSTDEVRKYHEEFIDLKITSVVYVPITFEKTKIGVLSINLIKNRKLTPRLINTLDFIGSLASLAITKAEAYQNMAEALDTRDKFISLAAHELRTPLTSIHGYIQLLHKKFKDKKSREQEWINELYSQTHRLIYIVNELLDITRISSKRQQYVLNTFDIIPIIERVMSRYKIVHSNRRYYFLNELHEKSTFIKGDSEKIDQLISHLLDNAEKFSLEDSPLTIVLASRGKQIVISIVNKGRILNDDLDHMFKKYYKGEHNMNTGMGLGLYLAKDIVKHHKGKIFLKKTSQNNVEASVYLPKLV